MKTDSIIKSIIDAVKLKDELKGVKCVYSKSRSIAQNPVCSFTLCIGLGKAQYNRNAENSGSEFTTEIKLCLLAPLGAGGKRLSEMSLWVAEAIREALNVSRITVSEPGCFDEVSTLYSDIAVILEDVSLAGADCKLYINSDLAEGIVIFEAESITSTEKKPELLKGYRTIETSTEYHIKIKSTKPLKTSESFELKAEYESFTEVYSGCCVTKLQRELTKSGNAGFIYNVTAYSFSFTEKEVQDE